MKYHVITPFSRFENLRPLIAMLEPHGIEWDIIMDEDVPFRLLFKHEWIRSYYCPKTAPPFWSVWRKAINWYLDTTVIKEEDRYCILNDDDAYEPGFFKKLSKIEGEVIICSMKRGDRIPPVSDPVRAHPTNTLIAAPENAVVCGVGAEQMIISGRLLLGIRLEDHPYADGIMISKAVKENGAKYVPDAFVWFNYYEPGRWNI